MEDISNRTIAVLIVAAIVISIGGTIISLNKISGGLIRITGKATTDTASVGLDLQSLAEVNFTTDTISWGTGNVVAGKSQCRLDSYSSSIDSVNCSGFTPQPNGLVLENIGNKNVSLNISFEKTAEDFIGISAAQLKWNVSDLESGSCGDWKVTQGNWINVSNTSDVEVCGATNGGFKANDDSDTLKLDVMVVIPSDTPPGAKSNTVTARVAEI